MVRVQRIIVPDTQERCWVLFDAETSRSSLRTNTCRTCIIWGGRQTPCEPMPTISRHSQSSYAKRTETGRRSA